jgi:LysM repeat protein
MEKPASTPAERPSKAESRGGIENGRERFAKEKLDLAASANRSMLGESVVALNGVASDHGLLREESVELQSSAKSLPAPEYRIKKGDTLSAIAKDNGVSLKALTEANPDLNPTKLKIGKSLNIPVSQADAKAEGRKAEVDKLSADRDIPALALKMPAKPNGPFAVSAALKPALPDVSAIPRTPAPEPQPEVVARDNAFSTFSLNVTDVSFKLAAASLEAGTLPDPGTIRSEVSIGGASTILPGLRIP